MERVIVDVQTGETRIVQMSEEEIASILAAEAEQAAIIAASKPTLEQLQAQLNSIQAQIAELAASA